jgi:hypothetical protein
MKSAAVYGGLLAVLLGVSWARWTAEPALELDGKVVMVAGEPDDLLSVTWHSENRDKAVITKKSDEHGDYYWVDYTRWTEVKPAKPAPKPPEPDEDPAAEGSEDGGDAPEAPEAPEPEPEPTYETSEQSFKSSDKAEEVFEDLAPLLALRKLTDITPEKREATGLDEATESVELAKQGKTVRISFGGEVYGTRDRYAQIEGSDDIYLVDDELLRSLKFARTRLPDRSLWPTETKNLAKVTVAAGENSVELIQKNAADPSKAAWVRASSPDEDATQAQTWMEKALKLKSVRYAEDDDEVDALELAFSLTLEDDKGASMTVEVLQEPGDNPEYYARSPHTRGLVRLLRGPSDQLAQDVATMVEGS